MSNETITIDLKQYKTMLNVIETLEKMVEQLSKESIGLNCLTDIFNECWPLFNHPKTDYEIYFRATFGNITKKVLEKHNVHLSRSVEDGLYFHKKSSN